ncbi:MAG: diguanylate cyclase [Rhodoferax sp.]|nr:diguanylate cyclase [Rhodoferax sp.]
MRRKNIGMVLADAIYWLFIGIPLVYIFYHSIMDASIASTTITMAKQAVNGVANTLLARLLYSGYALGTGSAKIAYRDIIYNLLSFFALYPALVLLTVSSQDEFKKTDLQIRNDLVHETQLMRHRIDVWSRHRIHEISHLAALAATYPPAQMQPRLVQSLESDPNFLRIGLLDKAANITAYSPVLDELGHNNIGKNFADRPFIPRLKESLKPMLSEVVLGQIGVPKPIVAVLAPVVKANEYDGYVAGILSLNEIKEFLEKNVQSKTMLYTLLDANGNVILTNHQNQKVMQPFVRSNGSLHRLDDNISQWMPTLPPNTPRSDRWKASSYLVDSPIGGLSEWRLILDQPVAPFQKVLYARYTRILALLFILLFVSLALAEIFSRKAVTTMEKLTLFTAQLPEELNKGAELVWPQSNVIEHHDLIERFKEMAASLSQQFSTNRELTTSLENRVAQRTAELISSEEKFRLLVNNSHDIIYTMNQEGIFTFVSPAWTVLLGHPVEEVTGYSMANFIYSEDIPNCKAALNKLFSTGQLQTNIEYRIRHADQSWRWHNSNAVPIKDAAGKVIGAEGIAKDVTGQKELEDAVRQLAFYDALTKLPNRRLLNDRLGQVMAASKRASSYAALMFLDLDNFKPLNDKHGHDVGDLLLVEVAKRLTDAVREMDTVARFGGDEFVVLLGDLGNTEPAAKAGVVAEKIRVSLSNPFLPTIAQAGTPHKVVEHHCSASIGVAVFVNHDLNAEDVLKWADDAMYAAKKAGRNSIRFHGAPPAQYA